MPRTEHQGAPSRPLPRNIPSTEAVTLQAGQWPWDHPLPTAAVWVHVLLGCFMHTLGSPHLTEKHFCTK